MDVAWWADKEKKRNPFAANAAPPNFRDVTAAKLRSKVSAHPLEKE
jgi:hypothetical protein